MDKLITPITEYSTRIAERGRGSGSLISERYLAMHDDKQFILSLEIEGRPPVAKKFCARVDHFVAAIASETGTPIQNVIDILSPALAKTLGCDVVTGDLNDVNKAYTPYLKNIFKSNYV